MGRRAPKTRTREAQRFEWFAHDIGVDQGITHEKIGSAIGVTQTAVSYVVKGRRMSFDVAWIRRIRDAFNVHPDYFFDDYAGRRRYTEFPARAALSARMRELEQRMTRIEKP